MSRDGRTMSLGPGADPPPPSGALLSAVAGMKAVSTRAPARALVALAAVTAAIPVGAVLVFGPRGDLAGLPVAWVVIMALLWSAGLALLVAAAARPRRGDVLPDTGRARRAALAIAAALVALGLLATVDGPATLVPEPTLATFGHWWWHCTSFGLKAIVPVLIVGGLLLRRLFPIGGAWAGAAVGAAGGAAAGLALHFICSIGGGLHVGLAHAGAVVVGAGLGAIALPRWLRG